MRKIAFGVAGFVALLVVAGLLAPRFLDWNHYKADIEAQVRAATGRDLKIGGDLDISILPQPTLVAEGLHLANVKGAAVGDMVALDRLEVRLAILPLLTGTAEASSLMLVRPTVELETLNDGRTNWTFEPAPAAAPAKPGPVEPPPRRSSSTFRVSRATVLDGAIVYRDSRTGMLERIDDLDAEMTMEGPNGPVRVVGSGAPRGVRARFEAYLGALSRTAPVPLSVTLDLDGGAARFSLDGTASHPDDKGDFAGKLRIEASDPVKLARTVFGGGSATSGLPGALAQRVELQSDISASARHLALSNLSLRHGESSATGTLSARFEKATHIDAKLAVDRLDLDAFVANRPAAPAQKVDAAPAAEKPKAADQSASPAANFEIPADVTGNVDVAINSLVAHGGELRNIHVVGAIGGGRVTLTKAAATLPGDTAVSAAGSIGAKKGAPVAEGTLNLSAADARALLQWLKADLSAVPDDRLRRLTLQTRFSATGDEVQIRDLQAAFDQTKLTGGATIALRQRPAFGLTVSVDRLDLDAYLPREATTGATAESQPQQGQQATPVNGKAPGPLAALAPLEAFDANMQARIGSLRYKGIDAENIAFDASLVNGTLTVRDASVKDLAGASGRLSGTLGGFTGTPAVRANLDLQAADATALLRHLGASPSRKLGRLAVTGTITSNAKDAALDLSLAVAGGSLKVRGPITNLDQPSYDLAVNADFANAGPLFGRDNLRLRLTGKAQGDAKSLALADLKGKVGPATVSGDVKVSLAEAKPKITAALATGDLPLELLTGSTAKPSSGTAAPGGAGGKSGGGASKAEGAERWSREPMDLAALKAFDGEFHVTSSAIKSGKASLSNAVIDASVKDGRFELRGVTGKLFNGAFDLKGKVSAAEGADFALGLAQFDVNQALRQLADLDRATGTANFKANVRGGLKSEWDFVSTLAGQGAVDGTVSAKVKEQEQAGATLLGALGGQAGGLGQGIEGAINGLLMAFGSGQGTLKGTFQADKGVVRTNDLQLVNAQATTRVTGAANLPSWTLDGEGQVVPAKAQQPFLTVAAKGALDRPDIKVGGTVLQNLGRGALQQLLPGMGKPQSGQTGQPQPGGQAPADPQQKQRINPKDVLKNLLKQPGG